MRQYLKIIIFLCICCCSISETIAQDVEVNGTEGYNDISIIPYPNSIVKSKGAFTITKNTIISVNIKEASNIGSQFISILSEYIDEVPDLLVADHVKTNSICFILDASLDLKFEAYQLNIDKESISIKSSSENGLFYGMQSLVQLFTFQNASIRLPALEINDAPRFSWRGMHLDVSRHFMPVSFIRKYIDYLAMNKLNVFHWHLVDGTGWRIEIKSHPELTDIGAWRVVKNADKPWKDIEAWREGDDRAKYGGFYTQKEIKEIVKYAQDRYVTVIPEIELPGHSDIVFDCFPDLLCQDNQRNNLKNIGVYCASNPKVYQLLEDVLDEVIALFPSEYIHIGGDEVNKSNWLACENCQKLMKSKGFDGKSLQSHFVNHFDEYLLSKGRKLIGWHEILEGELSESANVMYWGGINEFEDILKKGHPTVLTTGTSYYFDHYQSSSGNEPKAWGGYSPLRQVYDLTPIESSIDSLLAKQVLGIQANVWTEHMKTTDHVEYMVFPRMFALAENAWIKAENKSWDRFSHAVVNKIKLYTERGINCSPSAFRPIISTSIDKASNNLKVNIQTELPTRIYYTLDGSVPSVENGKLYTHPIILEATKEVKAISILNDEVLTEVESLVAVIHKAKACEISLKNEPHTSYSASGAKTLLDLEKGGNVWGSGKWLGFLDVSLDAKIKLHEENTISRVSLSCIADGPSCILYPDEISIYISDDGTDYRFIKKCSKQELGYKDEYSGVSLNQFNINFKSVSCKYINVIATCPEKKGTFIFIDEIIVE